MKFLRKFNEGKEPDKSEISDLSRINLTDEKDQIVNKIKKEFKGFWKNIKTAAFIGLAVDVILGFFDRTNYFPFFTLFFPFMYIRDFHFLLALSQYTPV